MNKKLHLITYLVVLGIVSPLVSSLKEGDCEGKFLRKSLEFFKETKEKYTSYVFLCTCIVVCIATVKKFGDTLDDQMKSDPKKIEEEFKKFCKGTKSKENRFVSLFFNFI